MRSIFVTTLTLLFMQVSLFGQIEYKTVETEGIGLSLNEAINDAIAEAIGRINGKSVDAKSQLKSVEISQSNKDQSEYFSSEAFKKSINTATKGTVSEYDIKSQQQNEDGSWHVIIVSKIAKYKRSADSNRKRLAVMPLRISESQFIVDGRSIEKNQISRILGQNLVTQLVQTRKFTVLDREYIEETLGEKNNILNGDVPVEEMARLGQELAADYILVGVLENLNFQTNQVQLRTTNRIIESKTGKIEVSYRIIDVATKQIKYADFARLNISEDDIRKLDNSYNLSNVDSAITMVAADRIGKKIMNAIYPMIVVSVQGETVTLNQGGELIKIGDVYEVFRYGENIIDPYTKESLGRQETLCATIEITKVNPKVSLAKIVHSEIDLNTEFQEKGFVCRMKNEAESGAEKKIQEMKQAKEERKKKRDSDW